MIGMQASYGCIKNTAHFARYVRGILDKKENTIKNANF
jgi:hypothetical protein